MQIQNFDATNIPPQQAGGKHPEGKGFPFQITNTFGQENKAKDGGMLVVEMTSPAGRILNYYNLYNKNDTAREIAHKELSALCHSVGIFKLTTVDGAGNSLPMTDWARELRGGRGVMDIGPQTSNPDYVEVKKVYDSAGNEPGKGPAPAPQPAANGGWGAPANTAPATPANAPAPAAAPQGWQQGPAQAAPASAPVAKPPWAQ